MPRITTIFCDIGGVLLTNGWDYPARQNTLRTFDLDQAEFEERHAPLGEALETGQLSLAVYLDRTVFYRDRQFSRDEFTTILFSQSRRLEDTFAIIAKLALSGPYFMATLNNESLELNQFRIEKFGLRKMFTVFISSCYLGIRKPDAAIYRAALGITRRSRQECLFVDDRAPNVAQARELGMRAIHCQNATQLREEIRHSGLAINAD
jgi:putative hydrolase of the HAD superfamily